MIKIPKRRKSKDNPYTIFYSEELQQYCISFFDVKNVLQKIIISKQLFEVFNKFELEDISQMHKIDKYIEHSEIYDETLYKRALYNSISIESLVENKIKNEKLKQAICNLNKRQQKRIIMYYFQNKTLKEIAEIEKCSIQAINKNIKNSLNKLKNILLKNNFL